MVSKANKKPPLLAQVAVKVQISTDNFTTTDRNQAIIQLYKLVKDDPQARRFLAALLEELDEKEATE